MLGGRRHKLLHVYLKRHKKKNTLMRRLVHDQRAFWLLPCHVFKHPGETSRRAREGLQLKPSADFSVQLGLEQKQLHLQLEQ